MMAGMKVVQAVVVDQSELTGSQFPMQLALFTPDGDAISIAPDTGATVKLTGFTTGTAGSVAATDTVNQALAKLQARIVALETP